MRSDDERFMTAYSGEIHNFHALRKILESKVHRFRGRSDPEVVAACVHGMGTCVFCRFEGMFALSV